MGYSSSFNASAVILMLLGIVFMLENYGVIHGSWFIWPLLPLIIGAGFCMLYFRTKKDIVLLGLGAFILLNSIFFFYLNLFGWAVLASLWPIFIIILGITFLLCYIFLRMKTLIYLSVLLMALGASFILIFAVSTRLWPLSLVMAGASFIIINIFEHHVKGVYHAKKK